MPTIIEKKNLTQQTKKTVKLICFDKGLILIQSSGLEYVNYQCPCSFAISLSCAHLSPQRLIVYLYCSCTYQSEVFLLVALLNSMSNQSSLQSNSQVNRINEYNNPFLTRVKSNVSVHSRRFCAILVTQYIV